MSRIGSLAYLVGIILTIVLAIIFPRVAFLPIVVGIIGLLIGFMNLDKEFGFIVVSLFFILVSPQLNFVVNSFLNQIDFSFSLFTYLTCATLPAAIKLVFYED